MHKKIAKLATIRDLPNIIKNGRIITDNVANKYNSLDKNKTFAYIECETIVDGNEIVVKLAIKKSPQKNKFWVHSIYTKENVSDSPASTVEGTEAGHITADNGINIPQKSGVVNPSDEKTSKNSGESLSYTPAIDEQELTRMARDGEITTEEYGRRMLEMKESKSVDDIYAIARMSPEDLTTTPDIDRRKGEAKGDGESKFHGSIQRSGIFDEPFKAEAKSDEFIRRYETITNKETLNKAAKLLDEGVL